MYCIRKTIHSVHAIHARSILILLYPTERKTARNMITNEINHQGPRDDRQHPGRRKHTWYLGTCGHIHLCPDRADALEHRLAREDGAVLARWLIRQGYSYKKC